MIIACRLYLTSASTTPPQADHDGAVIAPDVGTYAIQGEANLYVVVDNLPVFFKDSYQGAGNELL
jgi:hypothetical protein